MVFTTGTGFQQLRKITTWIIILASYYKPEKVVVIGENMIYEATQQARLKETPLSGHLYLEYSTF